MPKQTMVIQLFTVPVQMVTQRLQRWWLKKSTDFNIDLNAKDQNGKTAFQYACNSHNLEIVKMMIQKSIEFNIDLNVSSNYGWTAFHTACFWKKTAIVEMMIDNANFFKLDCVNGKGKTGYQIAKSRICWYCSYHREKTTKYWFVIFYNLCCKSLEESHVS